MAYSNGMLLLRECYYDPLVIIESEASKDLYISGIFMQTNSKNKNERVYPLSMMHQKIKYYLDEYVVTNRALGELDHPASPNVNLDRVSHLVTELKFDGPNIIGKAKIIEDVPCGKIAGGLIRAGAKLGVSSRGTGSVAYNEGKNFVQSDFSLKAIDLVHNPSAGEALVNGILESADWVFCNGVWKEVDIDSARKTLNTKYNEEKAYNIFCKLMQSVK